MISSQRILLIFFFVSLVIGISSTIYEKPTLASYVAHGNIIFGTTQATGENQNTQYSSTDTLYSGIKNKDYITETTVGNPITWTQILFNIFNKGFNPFSINPLAFETYMEQGFAWLLVLLKNVFGVLTAIEIYSYFKNKKTP